MFQISKLDDAVFYYWLFAAGKLNWEHLLFKKPAREGLPWLLKQRIQVRELEIDGSRQNEMGILASLRYY